MKSPKTRVKAWALFFILNVFDLLYLIFMFETDMEEMNPIARRIMSYGTNYIIAFKIFLVMVFYHIMEYCFRNPKKSGLASLKTATGIFTIVTFVLIIINIFCLLHLSIKVDENRKMREEPKYEENSNLSIRTISNFKH